MQCKDQKPDEPDFDQQFERENPFDLISNLVIESLRNDALRDALVRQTAPPKPARYDLAGAAKFLWMSQRKLREMVKARRIACTRIDYRNFLITEADLNEFLVTYKTKPKRI